MNVSAEHLHSAFDLMPAQVAVLDVDGIIQYINQSWQDFAVENGYSGRAFEGVNYLDLCDCTEGIEAPQSKSFSVGLKSVIGGFQRMFEQVYPCHAPHEKRWFKGIAYRYKGQVAVVHVDITEEYQRLDRLAGLFDSAELIHDLRSPLNAIIGFSDMALAYDRDNIEKLHDSLDIIKRSGERMLALVNEVLETARLGAKNVIQVETAIDLSKLLTDIIEENKSLAVEAEISVGLSAPNSLYIHGEERSLWKIFANLISNAIKYNRNGGGVSVKADLNPANGVVVEVVDTGIGISETDLSKVLDPFYRGNQGAQTKEGTGLGLAIVKDLVAKHDGVLSVHSSLGEGATFIVEFPSWRTIAG